MSLVPFINCLEVFFLLVWTEGDCFCLEIPHKSDVYGQVAEKLVFGCLPGYS